MSQDPYPSERPSSGSHRNPYDGGAYGGPGSYGPSPSNQQPHQTGGYQQGMYQPAYQTMEGEKAAQLSLIFGLVGFFVAGIILGPLAIWQARKAERLGVPATAGKILGWIVTAFHAIAVLFFVVMFIIFFAGLGAATGLTS